MVNLAQSPERLWSLPLIGVWTALLVIHCLIILVWPLRRAARRPTVANPPTPGATRRDP